MSDGAQNDHIPIKTRAALARTLGSWSVAATGGGGSVLPVKLETAVRADRTEYSTVNTQSRGCSQNCPITAKFCAPLGRTSGRSAGWRGMNWLVTNGIRQGMTRAPLNHAF